MCGAFIGDRDIVEEGLHESGRADATGRSPHAGCTEGLYEIVEVPAPHECGRFNSKGSCALMIAVDREHGDCVPHLLRELPCRAASGVPCAPKLLERCRQGPTSTLVGLI